MNAEKLTKQFAYLDRLRASGRTNMFGAGLFLESGFGLTQTEANDVLGKWMDTFDPEKTPEKRVESLSTRDSE